jgi:probable rRNA maturation factor
MAIAFAILEHCTFKLPQKLLRKKWLQNIVQAEGNFKIGELNYIFCTDEELLEVNKVHLNHDYYTDIITFDMAEYDDEIAGDIYVSIDRITDHAQSLGEGFERELSRVLAHGLLHLCGYGDKDEAEIPKMRAAEERAINLWQEMIAQKS